MKKLLNVKWENIMAILTTIFFTTSIIKHIIRNGFDWTMFLFEILIYGLVASMTYIAFYSIRRDLKEERK